MRWRRAIGSLKVRNRDAEYPFRQDSDFHYLTGFNEPEAVAVFVPGREQGEYVLFCREKNDRKSAGRGYAPEPKAQNTGTVRMMPTRSATSTS